ncbi:glycoside hydrolase family 2 TIM barrel-domain containing protein [Kribbella sp. NPDC006257]|uniref:glycoside hydrolase family 2 protein n=1 Tax=Kribbella sp. NPDC006257 TaxID=3156738 RepID=UPI0033B2EA3E
MRIDPIHDAWTIAALPATVPTDAPAAARAAVVAPVPAQVPGSVHTDLMAARIIPDPYLDANEKALRWMFGVDWQYRRPLTLRPAVLGERVELVFDGLDTVATIALGGAELGRTVNMHRSYRFDVTALADGIERELVVDLASATNYAVAERKRLGNRPSPYRTPFQFIRKMACSFGWDWGPDLRTAGIWKGVRVERWQTARIAQVRPMVTVDLGADDALTPRQAVAPGRVETHIEVERAAETSLLVAVEVAADGRTYRSTAILPPGETSAVVVVDVPDAPVWWPAGYGDQPLADLTVTVGDDSEASRPLDRWERRIGFRTVAVDTSEDDFGSAFTLLVNGRPVFVKGVNWIPDDHFLTRITRDRLADRLDQAVAAQMNLVRIWGGGIYESEDFYSLCDERGILVWQDFLLACAAYPEEEPLWSEIEAEARENIVRLMPHPSLAVWNGGNENLWGHEDWGWKYFLWRPGKSLTWGERYARELLPRLVRELDPTRPYTDNSPASPGADRHPNDPDRGTHHQWEVWNRVDYSVYRSEVPRFCSEFGFQGPPSWRTLQDWVRPSGADELTKNDPVFLVHQKADDGNRKLDRGMKPHLGVPDDFTDWHWATQLNQARAVAYGIEHYRSWWPRTAGSIVWQLNDCWPVTSWAAIDSEQRLKPLWFALRDAYAPRLLTVSDRAGGLSVAVVNDTDEPLEGTLEVSRQKFDGAVLADGSLKVTVAPRAVQVLVLPAEVASADDEGREALIGVLGELSFVHLFVEPVDADLDPAPLDVQTSRIDGGYRVDVSARSLAIAVHLNADRIAADATVDRGLVNLPAGGTASFVVTTSSPDLLVDVTAPPVLRTANDLTAI